jgi:radical SAM superfamily enzyme YgiQ (UPF0313 family)
MRIILVEPPVSPYDVPTGLAALPEPLSLEILAAAVPEHEIKIVDMRIDDRFVDELETFKPDLVGVTAVTANLHLAKEVLRAAKRSNVEIKTVIGGHHASLIPGDCFDTDIDAVVVGEGERTFPELVRAWEKGLALGSVSGLAYRSDGKFIFTGERDLIDVDTMPTANRALTKEYRKNYFRGSWRPTGSVIFSRGCPFRCEFCAEWKINRGKYRVRDPRSVMREIAGMEEYYMHFIDDNTFENVGKARELAECIKAEGVKKKYEVYGRSDTIVKHPELIEQWREIGLELVLIGLEAIDHDKLKSWNKRISPSVNDEAITILHKNGIEIAAYFIIDPDFGREDFDALLSYIEKRKLTHPIFTVLSPFPGTELRERRRKELLTDSYQILDFFHTVLPTRLPLEEFYDNFSDLYFKSYSFKKALRHVFRSKAFLSPRLIVRNRKLKKKFRELHGHHREILDREAQPK